MTRTTFTRIINSERRTIEELFFEAKAVIEAEPFIATPQSRSKYIVYVPLFKLKGLHAWYALAEDRLFDSPSAVFDIRENGLVMIYDYRDTEGSKEIFDDDLKHRIDKFHAMRNVERYAVDVSVKECLGVLDPNHTSKDNMFLFESKYKNEDELSAKTSEILKKLVNISEDVNGIWVENMASQAVAWVPINDRGYDNMGGNCSSVEGYIVTANV